MCMQIEFIGKGVLYFVTCFIRFAFRIYRLRVRATLFYSIAFIEHTPHIIFLG